jgi:carbonic anhydrase/acetyltransferase-like protein (isoleucine patch superfamily)
LVIGDVQIGKDAYIGHGAILRGDYGTIHWLIGISLQGHSYESNDSETLLDPSF